ncbi:PF01796 domain protein [Leptospira interrogans serovar Bataviae str. HAI135]|nr:PF01796 domain protein [Leptospira interrogans serovar Bataviae str. HAI135]
METTIACTRCGSSKTSEIQFSGKGTIYTYTIVYVGFGHLSKRVPYVLAVVELEEGIKTIGILEGKISGIPVTEYRKN